MGTRLAIPPPFLGWKSLSAPGRDLPARRLFSRPASLPTAAASASRRPLQMVKRGPGRGGGPARRGVLMKSILLAREGLPTSRCGWGSLSLARSPPSQASSRAPSPCRSSPPPAPASLALFARTHRGKLMGNKEAGVHGKCLLLTNEPPGSSPPPPAPRLRGGGGARNVAARCVERAGGEGGGGRGLARERGAVARARLLFPV